MTTDAKEPEIVASVREQLAAAVGIGHPDEKGYIAFLSEILDHIATLTRERDEARRDGAAMRELLAVAFREGWNCGDWGESRGNVSAREYDWIHSAVKAKADAARTADAPTATEATP